MIKNNAVLAAWVVVFFFAWVMAELTVLAPYKHALFPRYLWVVVGALVALFLNLFAVFYTVSRHIFLKDSGRKLAHVERQLKTPDTIVRDLSDRLSREEREERDEHED